MLNEIFIYPDSDGWEMFCADPVLLIGTKQVFQKANTMDWNGNLNRKDCYIPFYYGIYDWNRHTQSTSFFINQSGDYIAQESLIKL